MDDQPVGGGQKTQMSEFPDEQVKVEASGPLEQRIIAKNWQHRKDAYGELLQLVKDAKNGGDPVFKEHACMIKKYLTDSNPGSLEVCIDTLKVFIQRCKPDVIKENQNDMIKVMIEKCFTHMKPLIKTKTTELFISMFEHSESFTDSIETFEEMLKHKVPKNQEAACNACNQLVLHFGVKNFKVQDMMPAVLKCAQSTNAKVKTEAMNFFKTCSVWYGAAIESFLDGLKDVQIKEIKTYAEESKEKPKPTLTLTVSQAKKKKEQELSQIIEKEEAATNDGYDDAIEIEIVQLYGPEWQDNILGLKKWNEKVEQLEKLNTSLNVDKLAKGNYDGIIAVVKKMVSDAHSTVAQHGCKSVGLLSKGLRADFEKHGIELIPAIMVKFKEKRQMFVDECKQCLELLKFSVRLDQIAEHLGDALKNANPLVRKHTVLTIESFSLETYKDHMQDATPTLMEKLVKCIDDKDGAVRESTLHVIGIMKAKLGEQYMEKYLEKIPDAKKPKIQEGFDKVQPSKYEKVSNWKELEAAKAAKMAKQKAAAAKKEESKSSQPSFGGGDDELDMNFDSKPKRAPPKGIGQRPVKKKPEEDAGEEELKSSPAKPAVKKPPPNIGQKPAPKTTTTAKPATSTKAPTGPVIKEENLGQAMEDDEAIEIVGSYYNSEFVGLFEEAKWQDKQKGYIGFQEEIESRKPSMRECEATAKFIKIKMKNFKESNINLQKECIKTFTAMATHCEKMGKRTAATVMPFASEKIGDVKLVALITEMINSMATQLSPNFVVLQLLKTVASTKAPNNHIEACKIISALSEDYGVNMLPLKESIDYGIVAVANTNVKVRNEATKLFQCLYKHVGEKIRPFLNDIKESTLKVINDELAKVTPYKKGEFTAAKALQGEAAEEMESGGGGGGGGLDSLPREDVSKKITSKMLEKFKSKAWQDRKGVAEAMTAIIAEANNRIKTDGINEMMEIIKNAMKDPNKTVAKEFMKLSGAMAEACGPDIKKYVKKCLVPLIANCSDKQSLVRNDAIDAMIKWSEEIGYEVTITQAGIQLILENPELRTEVFNFILKNKDSIKKADCPQLVKPLISCFQDKSKAIKDMAEQVTLEVMQVTGHKVFDSATKDLKPAVKTTVQGILKKVQGQCVFPESENAQPKEEEKKEEPKGPTLKKEFQKDDKPKNSFAVAASSRQRDNSTSKNKPSGLARQNSSSQTRAKPTGLSRTTKKQDDDDDEIRITVANKQRRADVEAKSKWQLEDIKSEQIDKLKTLCQNMFGLEFMDKMFSKDYKVHIKCVAVYEGFITSQPDELEQILDVLFKWAWIKLMESSNTQLLISCLNFFEKLFKYLEERDYQIWDFENAVLMPLLCEKIGVNNATLQEKVKGLVWQVFGISDHNKTYRLLLKYGVQGKNLKGVAASLNIVSEFVEFHQDKCTEYLTDKDLKVVAKTADASDKGAREAAVKTLGSVYRYLGMDIYKAIGTITDKVKGLLEGRFKIIDKELGRLDMSATAKDPKKSASMMQNKPVTNRATTSASAFNKSAINLKSSQTPRMGDPKFGLAKKAVGESTANDVQPQDQPKKFSRQSSPMAIQKKTKLADISALKRGSIMPVSNTGLSKSAYEGAGNMRHDIGDDRLRNTQLPGQPQDHSMMSHEQNFVGNEDDEDLLDIVDNDKSQSNLDPAVQKQINEIKAIIVILKTTDLSKRVDGLVALNDCFKDVEIYQQALNIQANELVSAFVYVMIDTFNRVLSEIPLRFAKYFLGIVCKVCQCRAVMKQLKEETIYELVEQLLTRLLIDKLETVGEKQEGQIIIKNLNSSMLRLLENCDNTIMFCVLFRLLRVYREDPQQPKIPGLIIKCLMKLHKVLEKLIDRIQIDKILVVIHEYLLDVTQQQINSNDDNGIRLIKTVVNDLVKLKKEAIWEAYTAVSDHPKEDKYIYRWIQIILQSIKKSDSTSKSAAQPGSSSHGDSNSSNQPGKPGINFNPSQSQDRDNQDVQNQEDDQAQEVVAKLPAIDVIIEQIKDPERFQEAIPLLYSYMFENPSFDLMSNLEDSSPNFISFIQTNLDKHEAKLPHEKRLSSKHISERSTANNTLNSNDTNNQGMMMGNQMKSTTSFNNSVDPNTSIGQSNISPRKGGMKFQSQLKSFQAKQNSSLKSQEDAQKQMNSSINSNNNVGVIGQGNNQSNSQGQQQNYQDIQSKISQMRQKFMSKNNSSNLQSSTGIQGNQASQMQHQNSMGAQNTQSTSQLQQPSSGTLSNSGMAGGSGLQPKGNSFQAMSAQKRDSQMSSGTTQASSISALNSSLRHKLTQFNQLKSNQGGIGAGNAQNQMSSTMIGGGFRSQNKFARAGNLNASNGSTGVGQFGANQDGNQQLRDGATNKDLNARLDEMKARLHAYKNK